MPWAYGCLAASVHDARIMSGSSHPTDTSALLSTVYRLHEGAAGPSPGGVPAVAVPSLADGTLTAGGGG